MLVATRKCSITIITLFKVQGEYYTNIPIFYSFINLVTMFKNSNESLKGIVFPKSNIDKMINKGNNNYRHNYDNVHI